MVLRLPHLSLALVLAAAAGLLSGCGGPADQQNPDAAAARKVVAAYLAAVEARDAAAVAKLVTPGNEATEEIEARLARYGGRRAADADVRYASDFGGQVMNVTVADPGASGAAAVEEVQLVADRGRWYVAFGQSEEDGPPRATASEPAP